MVVEKNEENVDDNQSIQTRDPGLHATAAAVFPK